jgi:hypothetical protein
VEGFWRTTLLVSKFKVQNFKVFLIRKNKFLILNKKIVFSDQKDLKISNLKFKNKRSGAVQSRVVQKECFCYLKSHFFSIIYFSSAVDFKILCYFKVNVSILALRFSSASVIAVKFSFEFFK